MDHLDLSQCEKLCDIGFPQGETEWLWVNDGKDINWNHVSRSAGYAWSDWPAYGEYKNKIDSPTLEELIAWLGDDFGAIAHWPGLQLPFSAFQVFGGKHKGGYKTPLLAVYHLTLAIKGDHE